MNQDLLLQRAQMLIGQNRPDQAAEQLRQLLSQNPNVPEAHSLLALCLTQNRDQWHEATREAEQGIHLAPDQGLSHYAHAVVLDKRNHLQEALVSANEAIRLDSYQPHFFALSASILAQQDQWQSALDTASRGMEIDPDHEGCAAIRSLALERLGRRGDAVDEADAAVRRNPDSAEAHAMRGWALMHDGKHRPAQDAFREALRLDPNYEFARSGMIQALNNNHFIFRQVFRFYAFMGRMQQRAQWALILGLYFGMQILRRLADQYPALSPYVTPISCLYLGFCLLTWTANPLFNTFLRFHSFGKYLLSDKQKWASNLVASCFLLGIVGAIAQIVAGNYPNAIVILIVPLLLTLPISTAFNVDRGWPQIVAGIAASGMALLCLLTMGLITLDGPWGGPFLLYVVCTFLFSIAGNWLMSVTVKH